MGMIQKSHFQEEAEGSTFTYESLKFKNLRNNDYDE